MLIWDTPYELKKGKWDILFTETEIADVLSAFEFRNSSSWTIAFIWHHFRQADVVAKALLASKYVSPHPLYWHKDSYSNAVEQAMVAYKPSKTACHFQLSHEASERHNHMQVPLPPSKVKKAAGVPLNPCQKPVELMRRLMANHLVAGEHVISLGSGTGPSLEAAVRLQVHPTSVENDRQQFAFQQERLITLAALLTAEKEAFEKTQIDMTHDQEEEGDDNDGGVEDPEKQTEPSGPSISNDNVDDVDNSNKNTQLSTPPATQPPKQDPKAPATSVPVSASNKTKESLRPKAKPKTTPNKGAYKCTVCKLQSQRTKLNACFICMEKYHPKCGVDQGGTKAGNKGYIKPLTVDKKVIQCCSTKCWQSVVVDYPKVWCIILKQLKKLKKPPVQSEPPNIKGPRGKGIGQKQPKPPVDPKK